MSINAKPWESAGGAATVPDASETTKGKIRIATTAESTAGLDDLTAMTPAKVKARIDAALVGGVEYKGEYTGQSLVTALKGDMYISSGSQTLGGVSLSNGDHIIFNEDAANPVTSSMFDVIDNTETPASETVAGVIEIATNAEATAASATDKALVPSNISSIDLSSFDNDLSADDFAADHTAVYYTAANANIDGHLSGIDDELGLKAPLASPSLTGTPTAPTATQGDNSTKLATTAYVDTAVSGAGGNQITDVSSQTGSSFTATANEIYICGYSTGTQTITFPDASSSTDGDLIGLTSVTTTEFTVDLVSSDGTTNDLLNMSNQTKGGTNGAITLTLKQELILFACDGVRWRQLSRELADVAKTGAYSDLSGTPTLATVATTGAYSDLSGTPTLATVATTGAYSDLTGEPTALSDLTNDLSADDFLADHVASNYTPANNNIDGHLSGIDSALGSAGGATDLDGLSDVTITTPTSSGQILRNNGSGQFVNTSLSIVDDTTPQLGGNLDPNGFGISGNLVPSTANNRSLGTSSAEWSDLYIGDQGKIFFGNDQDVELIHDPDDGLILDLGVAEASNDPQFELRSQSSSTIGPRLKFNQESTSPAVNDRIGIVSFTGKDSGGTEQEYSKIQGMITDTTAGAEVGRVSILAAPGIANTRGLHVEGVSGQAAYTKVNIDHDGGNYGLHLNNTLVTTTAAELNLLDGGSTVGSSITITDTDGFVINDGGTTKLIPASDLKTYAATGGGATDLDGLSDVTITTPTSSGQILRNNGLGQFVNTSLSIVDDTTPQLGGNLDVNGNAITSASNGNVTINPDGTGDISVGADIIPDADATHTLGSEDNRFITLHSELNGAVQFKARNETGGPLTKGQAVYISGVSGDVPLVSLAQANSASTMPAHGLLAADVSNNADVQVISFGNLTAYNTTTHSLSLGDTVYVSAATAGALTSSAPAGETNLIQNIGKVVRASATEGIIKVGGAGRSAATPNLDNGKIFLGNASNQAVSTALSSINLTSFNDDLGSTYQPLDAQLTDVAGLTPANGAFIVGDGNNFITESGATARTSLGAIAEVSEDSTPQLGGDLDVNANEIISASNNNVVIRPNGTGHVFLGGNTNPAEIRLYCEVSDQHYVGFKSAAHADYGTSVVWELPAGDGSANQVLETNGSGVLSWVDQSGGGGGGGFTYSAVSTATTAQAQYHYSVTGTTTITLPASSGITAGHEVRVKNMGTDTVTVSRSSTDTIDGQTSITMAVQYQALNFISNGSNGWEII